MPGLVNEQAAIVANEKVGPGLHLMKLAAPQIAARIKPGQFVHMRLPAMNDHILRRPFSIYDCDRDAGMLEVLYQVVGFGTDHMTGLQVGESTEIIGPVGRGWEVPKDASRCLLVAGGVGAAPLFMLADELMATGRELDVILGAQTVDALVARERYEALLETPPRCSTDDGSFGFSGFCTPLVDQALNDAEGEGRPYDYLAVCGPEPLMKIVVAQAKDHGVFCELSMERRMACGIGACLSCVVDTVAGKKRSCIDGPVFSGQEVVWS